jgi:hypothetical protein
LRKIWERESGHERVDGHHRLAPSDDPEADQTSLPRNAGPI